jgi:hypothetical protein
MGAGGHPPVRKVRDATQRGGSASCRRLQPEGPPIPLRIAFVSCMSSQVFPEQRVWDWIAARQPDHLVKLGDSLYLDVPLAGTHPSDMGDDAFAQHLYANYTGLMAQPRIKALV